MLSFLLTLLLVETNAETSSPNNKVKYDFVQETNKKNDNTFPSDLHSNKKLNKKVLSLNENKDEIHMDANNNIFKSDNNNSDETTFSISDVDLKNGQYEHYNNELENSIVLDTALNDNDIDNNEADSDDTLEDTFDKNTLYTDDNNNQDYKSDTGMNDGYKGSTNDTFANTNLNNDSAYNREYSNSDVNKPIDTNSNDFSNELKLDNSSKYNNLSSLSKTVKPSISGDMLSFDETHKQKTASITTFKPKNNEKKNNKNSSKDYQNHVVSNSNKSPIFKRNSVLQSIFDRDVVNTNNVPSMELNDIESNTFYKNISNNFANNGANKSAGGKKKLKKSRQKETSNKSLSDNLLKNSNNNIVTSDITNYSNEIFDNLSKPTRKSKLKNFQYNQKNTNYSLNDNRKTINYINDDLNTPIINNNKNNLYNERKSPHQKSVVATENNEIQNINIDIYKNSNDSIGTNKNTTANMLSNITEDSESTMDISDKPDPEENELTMWTNRLDTEDDGLTLGISNKSDTEDAGTTDISSNIDTEDSESTMDISNKPDTENNKSTIGISSTPNTENDGLTTGISGITDTENDGSTTDINDKSETKNSELTTGTSTKTKNNISPKDEKLATTSSIKQTINEISNDKVENIEEDKVDSREEKSMDDTDTKSDDSIIRTNEINDSNKIILNKKVNYKNKKQIKKDIKTDHSNNESPSSNKNQDTFFKETSSNRQNEKGKTNTTSTVKNKAQTGDRNDNNKLISNGKVSENNIDDNKQLNEVDKTTNALNNVDKTVKAYSTNIKNTSNIPEHNKKLLIEKVNEDKINKPNIEISTANRPKSAIDNESDKNQKQFDWPEINKKLNFTDSKQNQKVQVEIPMTAPLLEDIIEYVQKQIEKDEVKNKIKDSNFDIIHAAQEDILKIVNDYENNNESFNGIKTSISVIKSIIDFYTTLFQENKKLNEKLAQITKLVANGYSPAVNKLFEQFENNTHMLNLIKFIFASDNEFFKNVQLQSSSKYLPEQVAKRLIENYLNTAYPIISGDTIKMYQKFFDEISAKLRTNTALLPTKFIFIICQALSEFTNTYLSQLVTANTNFNGQCVIFKQRLSELPNVEDSVDVKSVAKLKMYVSELEKYQSEISSKTDNIINLINEIVSVLSQNFGSYTPDTKILALITN